MTGYERLTRIVMRPT
jgi:hypothetical protein